MMDAERTFDELFAPEEPEQRTDDTQQDEAWKVLLVDDEADMHTALHITLEDITVEGKPLQIYDASSGSQARQLLADHPDIALILLDVVMETEDAGLELVRYVRNELHNRTTQIVVVTGQPGYAPQREVVARYEIDGYRLKSELTSDKIFVTVYAVLRAHQALCKLVEQREEMSTLALTLREREERLRTVIESAPDAIVLADERGLVFGWNRSASQLFGYARDEIVGRSFAILAPPYMREDLLERLKRFRDGNDATSLHGVLSETIAQRADGTTVPVELALGSWRMGEEHHFSAIIRDIRERRHAEEGLRLAASVFANSYEGIIISNAQRIVVDVNPAFSRMTGYSAADAIGKPPRFLTAGLYDPEFYASISSALANEDFWQGETECRRKDGTLFTEVLSICAVRDQRGAITHYIDVFSDITLVKEHEKELIRVANYDSLTGLPNRRLLADRISQGMAAARRSGRSMAVCYLDLDGFKRVNDELGHAMGDRLLVEVSERLKTVLREEDTLARMGGDEFIFLLTQLAQPDASRAVLDRILEEIAMPLLLNGKSINISGTIGVTIFPGDDVDADTLLRHADQAMYIAKDAGKGCYHFFDAERDRELKSHRLYAERIAKALTAGEFCLHYQPKVDLSDGRVVGVEALIRWQHPDRGLLLPGEFLPFIEGSDLEVEVGEWVLEEAMRQISRWKDSGLDVTVSVNISANHLLRRHFAERLQEMLHEHPDVRPEQFELEILETTALTDMKQAVQTLGRCQRMGIRISLDDFGTGYSSLTYLLKLPVQSIKVDQSFVRGMLDDPNKLGIVDGVVRLAHAFNRRAVAEGVETMEHAAMLLALNCLLVQGFGIARPMPPEEFPGWVADWMRRGVWRSLSATKVEGDALLSVARDAHMRWTQEILQGYENGEMPVDVSLDSLNCSFGRWYAGSGTARYAGLAAFEKLGQEHERVHRCAAELLATPNGSPAGQALHAELLAAHDRLLGVLRELS